MDVADSERPRQEKKREEREERGCDSRLSHEPMLLQMQSPMPSTPSTWSMWPPEVKPNFMLNLMKELTVEESGRNKKVNI